MAKFLDIAIDDIKDSGYSLEAEGGEYLVLTDDEANSMTKEYIKDSLWAFNLDFLIQYIDIEHVNNYMVFSSTYYDEDEEKDIEIGDPEEVFYMYTGMNLMDYLKDKQKEFEDANDHFNVLVGNNLDKLIRDAILSDGRGHFLSSYDGAEEEEGDYFIYRIN